MNSNLTIDCYIEAYPKSINFWRTSNGTKFKGSNNFKIFYRKKAYLGTMINSNEKYQLNEIHLNEFRYHIKLSIRNISKSDLTNYTCFSKNFIGESENSIQIYGISYETVFKILFKNEF